MKCVGTIKPKMSAANVRSSTCIESLKTKLLVVVAAFNAQKIQQQFVIGSYQHDQVWP